MMAIDARGLGSTAGYKLATRPTRDERGSSNAWVARPARPTTRKASAAGVQSAADAIGRHFKPYLYVRLQFTSDH